MNSDSNRIRAAPLETRHVFLDTQVYHKLRHNADNPAFKALQRHIIGHRVVLHITDITMMEVQRQLRDDVFARRRELGSIENDLRRWRHSAPNKIPPALRFEPDEIAKAIYLSFLRSVVVDAQAVQHQALSVPARQVFDKYFDRHAPFDGKGSKEFPDAFVLQVLQNWCSDKDARIYVVTEDNAMLRAAANDERLIPIKSIEEVLRRASADIDQNAESIAEAIFAAPGFDGRLWDVIARGLGDVDFIYIGNLPDGEAYNGQLEDIRSLEWNIVGLSNTRISLILDVSVSLTLDVQYEDRTGALYDKESDQWLGVESAQSSVKCFAEVQVFCEVDTETGVFVESELMDSDITVYD